MSPYEQKSMIFNDLLRKLPVLPGMGKLHFLTRQVSVNLAVVLNTVMQAFFVIF
jgi:hypothetical protein